ncbi:ABC transporter ATP-binding protein [Stutzerimonas balearica]|uniref:ABC transporter ATP-binding protein n=1 Tax=Stutzerimonas balearica TaxID=74829 RepID=UPI003F75C915
MFEVYKKLNALFNQQERRKVELLFLLMLGAALVEVVGVASVMPFVAVLSNPAVVETNPYLAALYQWSGMQQPRTFMVILGTVVLVVFVTSLALKALTAYCVLRFSSMRAHAFSYRLLAGYMAKPYIFFLGRNTADLSKALFSEVQEVINGVLLPALKMTSGCIVAVLVITLLFVVEPVLTLVVGAVLGGSFFCVYVLSRRLLKRLGQQRVEANRQRFVLANEALNGNKELRLLGRERSYLERFEKASFAYASHQSASKALGDVPQYAIQAIAFGGVLVLVLYLMAQYGGLQQAMPMIALYAFAGYRLLPAFQEIFKNSTQLRFYHAALDSLHADLFSVPQASTEDAKVAFDAGMERLRGDVELCQVTFHYPDVDRPVIEDLSLKIASGSCVAFVGSTGAGKSTVVDLILGLLDPTAGEVRVAGRALNVESVSAWQRNIGYVPQSIYLADATVAENIAFGIPYHEIDQAAVERAAQAAHIHEFISAHLPEGYRTGIGERGIRLSGGQRQRIGIARALYHDPDVVVFDEATSALDNATEAAVMEAVNELAGSKTVILIAHRLSTVKRCDTIYMLNLGRLSGMGSYDELIKTNEAFNRMASGNA